MDFGLKGRKALVIGGGSGVGAGVAAALAGEGVEVTVAGRTIAKLEETVETIRGYGGTAHACVADLGDAALLANLASAVGDIDILINNCGGPPPGAISEVSDEAWLRQFELMFIGNVRLARAILPGMRTRGWGRIINVVSSGVIQPIPNLGISNALRLAVVGWSKTLAGEVAADGVTVNCLAPGRIQTDRIEELDAKVADRGGLSLDEVRARSRAAIPAGRYGAVEEFAAYATFLASDAASYVTGSVHRADGGMVKSI